MIKNLNSISRLFYTLAVIFSFMISSDEAPAADETFNFTIFFSGNVSGELDVCG